MMDEPPKGWKECQIGDIAQVIGGGTPDAGDLTNFSTEAGIPWLTPADLSGYKKIYVSHGKRFLTKKGFEHSSAKLMPEGAVLFSSRAPIGYVAIAANAMCTNQGFRSFVCTDGICSVYLYFWLKFAKSLAEELASGTTFAEISGTNAARIPLLLPPLTEQRRIGVKLERMLGQVDTCQERLARVPILLKRFRQSVLAAACSGRLTADWREGQDLHPSEPEPMSSSEARPDWPEGWRSISLRDVAEKVQDGNYGALYPKADEWISAGVAFIVPAAIASDGKIDLSKVRFISPKRNAELKKAQLTEGDVIFPNRGSRDAQRNGFEPFAISVPNSLLPANINPQLTLVRPRPEILLSAYLRIALNSEFFLSQVRETTGGSALTFINLTETKGLEIPLPPLLEQEELVRRVGGLFALADRIEARFAEGRKRVDSITQSILAKAFRGELVSTEFELAKAEGRSFESAEELLARIKVNGQIEEEDEKKSKSRRLRSSTGLQSAV